MTRDTWHVTWRDTWHVTCLGGWTFYQNFSSLAITVCDLWYYEYLEEKDDSINELISDKAVYRIAPATPGLLIMGFGSQKLFLFGCFSVPAFTYQLFITKYWLTSRILFLCTASIERRAGDKWIKLDIIYITAYNFESLDIKKTRFNFCTWVQRYILDLPS